MTQVSATTTEAVLDICRAAKAASVSLASLKRSQKDHALLTMADALVEQSVRILAANEVDVSREAAAGMSSGLLDRLTLTSARIDDIAEALRYLATLPDPVGEVKHGATLPNGLRLVQKSVPMGVVGMIYEARPNVTVDAAGLSLKSGNAAVLRGGSAAAQTNEVIVAVLQDALAKVGLPRTAIQSIDAYGRAGVQALMQARGLVDVLIPRGGRNLIQAVVRDSTVPAIETGEGNCHIYVDASAPVDLAVDIVENAKTQRLGVCNTVETLLVHEALTPTVLPKILQKLAEHDVTIHGDTAVAAVIEKLGGDTAPKFVPANDEDWTTEYLAAELAVKVVPDVSAAIEHIRTYSTGHTEAILTNDLANAEIFVAEVDSAAVMVNASTRFTDGGEFGLGAEIGISTQKLHARGPMGLAELTTTKWIVHGDGHVRP